MFKHLKWAVIFTLVGSCWNQDPVKVAVYYETKCPDSTRFIARQLWPAWQKVSQLFTVEFYPYGVQTVTFRKMTWLELIIGYLAKDGSTLDFTCQHGPEECMGNLIHGCAVKHYPNNSDNVPFISCSMKAGNPPAECKTCAEKNKLNWDIIHKCATGKEGAQLRYKNGLVQNALDPGVYYVPWITINGVFSKEILQAAQSNLLKLICDTYKGKLPKQCATPEN